MQILKNLTTLLNNPLAQKETTEKILKYFEMNENEKPLGYR